MTVLRSSQVRRERVWNGVFGECSAALSAAASEWWKRKCPEGGKTTTASSCLHSEKAVSSQAVNACRGYSSVITTIQYLGDFQWHLECVSLHLLWRDIYVRLVLILTLKWSLINWTSHLLNQWFDFQSHSVSRFPSNWIFFKNPFHQPIWKRACWHLSSFSKWWQSLLRTFPWLLLSGQHHSFLP